MIQSYSEQKNPSYHHQNSDLMKKMHSNDFISMPSQFTQKKTISHLFYPDFPWKFNLRDSHYLHSFLGCCPLYQNQDNNIVIRIHCNPNDLVPLEIIEHVLKLASAVNPGQVNCPGGRERTEDSFHPG